MTIPIRKVQNWNWSSVGTPPSDFESVKLHNGPVKRRKNWLDWFYQPLTEVEVQAMRQSRSTLWIGTMANQDRQTTWFGINDALQGTPRERIKVECTLFAFIENVIDCNRRM